MIVHFNGSQFNVPYEGGELDFQKLLGKFPGLPWAKYKGKKHLPGHNFTGAQTNLDKRLINNQPVPGSEPINKVDAASMRHDIAYRDNKDLKTRHAADRKMIQELDAIQNPTMRERFDRAIVKKALQVKLKIGVGLSRAAKTQAIENIFKEPKKVLEKIQNNSQMN